MAQIVGYIPSGNRSYFESHLNAADRLYLVARGLSVFFGVLAVIIAWRFARQQWGTTEANIAAFLLSIVPIQVIGTCYAKVDALMSFWCLVVIMSSAPLIKGQTSSLWLSGIAVGLAAATKYSAGVYLILPMSALLLGRVYHWQKWAILGSTALLGFIVGCPTVLWDFPTFWSYMQANMSAAQTGGMFSTGYGPWALGYLRFYLPYAFSMPLLALTIVSIFWAVRNRAKEPTAYWLAINTVVIFFVISRPRFQLVLHLLPLITCPLLVVARAAIQIARMPAPRWQFTMWSAALLLCLSLTAIYSAAYMSLFRGKDGRVLASDWIRTHIPEGQSIGIAKSYYWTPPILRQIPTPYELVGGTLPDANLLEEIIQCKSLSPEYFVLSDSEIREFLRQPHAYPLQAAAIQSIFQRYHLVAKFERSLSLGPWVWNKGWMPWDWMYPNPTIYILKMRSDSL